MRGEQTLRMMDFEGYRDVEVVVSSRLSRGEIEEIPVNSHHLQEDRNLNRKYDALGWSCPCPYIQYFLARWGLSSLAAQLHSPHFTAN
jgi:hypothetical protein